MQQCSCLEHNLCFGGVAAEASGCALIQFFSWVASTVKTAGYLEENNLPCDINSMF